MLKKLIVILSVFIVLNIGIYSQDNTMKISEINQKLSSYTNDIRSVPMCITLDFYYEKYVYYPIIENHSDNMVLVENPHSTVRLGSKGDEKKATMKCYFSEEYQLPFIKTSKRVKQVLGNSIKCYRTEEFKTGEAEPYLVEAFDGTKTKVLRVMTPVSEEQNKKKLGQILQGPKYMFRRFHPRKAWLKDSLDDSTNIKSLQDNRLNISRTNSDASTFNAILSPSNNYMVMEKKFESESSFTEIKVTQTTKAGDLILPNNFEEIRYRIIEGKRIPVEVLRYSNITYKILTPEECIDACKFEFPEGTIMREKGQLLGLPGIR